MEANAGSIGAFEHVAVVVRDLDRALAHYTNDLGIGPWAIYTLSPDWIRDMTVHGKEQGYVYTLALCSVGPVVYELLESVQGPNIYEEFLNERGEGLHHVGYFVEDIDAEISKMESRGFSMLQGGRGFGANDDGAYAYFDTERTLGCILEALEMPPEMPPPHRTYPPEQS
jgi:methylmalonyl-CoA/ethylmalonyl-CoA epimerase